MSQIFVNSHCCRILNSFIAVVLCCLCISNLYAAPAPVAIPAQNIVPVAPDPEPKIIESSPSLPMLDISTMDHRALFPKLEWWLDSSESVSINEIQQKDDFSPWQDFWKSFFMEEIPKESGAVWLRFMITASDNTDRKTSLVLDLNARVTRQYAGVPQVWLVNKESNATQILPIQPGLYPLPTNVKQPHTIYIHLVDLPNPSFSPIIREWNEDQGTIDIVGQPVLLAALAAGLLLCLIRGLAERREWRLWAALYCLAVGVYGFWGLPETTKGLIPVLEMPGLLAPGAALFILAHVGRYLMRSRDSAPYLDLQLIALALPSTLFSILPFIPGYAWLVRYLSFWPITILIFLPTVISACIAKVPGAKRFLLICLFPLLSLVAFLPQADDILNIIEFPHRIGWLSLVPLCGLALSVVTVALIATPKWKSGLQKTKSVSQAENAPLSRHERWRRAPVMEKRDTPPVVIRKGDLRDLRIDLPEKKVPTEKKGVTKKPTLAKEALALISEEPVDLVNPIELAESKKEESTPEPAPNTASNPTTTPSHSEDPLAIEEVLRVPLDAVFREIRAIDQSSLPPKVRRHADTLILASRRLMETLSDFATGKAQRSPAETAAARHEIFDLHEIMLEAHNSVLEEAEARNLGLSWFTAPSLPRSYEGDRERLLDVLKMLAESAVRATKRGGLVQIRVQRVPESTDPGHLLFTVSDAGKGAPPLNRSGLAIVRAWEMVGACGGSLSMESGPSGTSFSFSIRLKAQLAQPIFRESSDNQADQQEHLQEDDIFVRLPSRALRILIVSQTQSSRRLLAYYLDELPHEVIESQNIEEAVLLYMKLPGAMILFDDDILEEDIAHTLAEIHRYEKEHNIPEASVLALAADEDQEKHLRQIGCTNILRTPVSRRELRLLTLRLAPLPRRRSSFIPAEASTRADTWPGPRPESASRNVPLTKSIQPTGSSRQPFNPPSVEKEHQALLGSSDHPNIRRREKENRPTHVSITSVGEPKPLTKKLVEAPKEQLLKEKAIKKVQPVPLSRIEKMTEDIPLKTKIPQSLETQEVLSLQKTEKHGLLERLTSSFGSLFAGKPKNVFKTLDLTQDESINESPNNADEWVGEPMPIQTKKSDPKESDEWVGEPMPIPKTKEDHKKLDELTVLEPIPLKDEVEESVRDQTSCESIDQKEGDNRIHQQQESQKAQPLDQSVEMLASMLQEGQHLLEESSIESIIEGAQQIAEAAERLAQPHLSDLAKCVEEEAHKGQSEDLADLLKELQSAIERTLHQEKGGRLLPPTKHSS